MLWARLREINFVIVVGKFDETKPETVKYDTMGKCREPLLC